MTASTTDQVPELSLQQLRELRKSEDLLYVRNNTPTLITCNSKDRVFHIEPKGTSGSIQILPKEILDSPRFQKLWMKKAVTVSNDETMERQIQLLMGGELKLTQERMDEIMGHVTEPGQTKALEEHRCLTCDGRIFMSVVDVKEGVLPLCELHASEARHFVATLNAEGKYEYSRVTFDTTPHIGTTITT